MFLTSHTNESILPFVYNSQMSLIPLISVKSADNFSKWRMENELTSS